MSNYCTEGNIDFFKQLSNALTNTSSYDDKVCLITQLPLEEHCITLKCNHTFNYHALYKDIYNTKFKITSINSAGKYPVNKIKCPYCRSLQTTLLPYYEELGLPLVYGINTDNMLFTIVKNKHNKFVYDTTLSYFTGSCCFSNSINNITESPCKNTMVILHPETQKTYCFEHINIIKKEYNKKMRVLKKQKQKEEIKKQKEIAKEEMKKQKQKLKEETNPVILCTQILKTGINKGKPCNCKSFLLDKCKKHIQKNNTEL
jgi:hypothetical protein